MRTQNEPASPANRGTQGQRRRVPRGSERTSGATSLRVLGDRVYLLGGRRDERGRRQETERTRWVQLRARGAESPHENLRKLGCSISFAAPAKITSFGRRVNAALGARVRLVCDAVGVPPPLRTWSRRRPAPAIARDPRLLLEGDALVILSKWPPAAPGPAAAPPAAADPCPPAGLDGALADNYTCAVRNPWGEERATWAVRALAPPARPALRLAGAAAARLLLAWRAEPRAHGEGSLGRGPAAAGRATQGGLAFVPRLHDRVRARRRPPLGVHSPAFRGSLPLAGAPVLRRRLQGAVDRAQLHRHLSAQRGAARVHQRRT